MSGGKKVKPPEYLLYEGLGLIERVISFVAWARVALPALSLLESPPSGERSSGAAIRLNQLVKPRGAITIFCRTNHKPTKRPRESSSRRRF